MTDGTDILDEIQTTDDAYASAITPKKLDEIELQPFSLRRQTIAGELNSSVITSEFYDAVCTVWVCTLKQEELRGIRRNSETMEEAVDRAFKWAEERGYDKNAKPLMEIYKRLMTEIGVSTKASSPNGETPAKNDGGPQAN